MGPLGLLECRPQVIGVIGIAMVMMDYHLASVLGGAEFLEKGGLRRLARQVVKLEGLAPVAFR
ncbi:hypothetical protein HSBAA_48080 [Vreelandella sulfidaeris]|uniref:Uncharacterized protein n=1 Tax=Vreelandella sulfidaeris TaxID=115553 RepID=A0A455UBC8_9GAMM|nr:hypothetical protein HSBAA_48080 [Halomonas sulfidaeris]